MARKDQKLNPQFIGADRSWWLYEENGALTVVAEPEFKHDLPATRVLRIPWTRIRQMLARKDKP